jgi:putative transposase
MSWYRRNYVPGGTYFFTVVTACRRPLFLDEANRELLSQALKKIRAKLPFQTVAMVLLPDHLHAVWTLPAGDARYPRRWRQIKERFTVDFLDAGGREGPRSSSRIRHRERAVWQRRYWEHTVRDEDDLKRCVDYIHWNPKKHRLVQNVVDYPWSTFHRFVELGEYTIDWGRDDPCPGYDTPEWDDYVP